MVRAIAARGSAAREDGAVRLYLIRHGQTASNLIHALDTDAPGAELTDLGREQAAAIPAAVRDRRIDTIWCSPLVRTQQTAAPLAADRGLTPQVRDGLREVRAGALEMRSDREAVQAYLDCLTGWADDPSLRVEGGESFDEVVARFDGVVDEIHAQALGGGHEAAAVVTHGAMMRVWTAYVVQDAGIGHRPAYNTCMAELEGEPGAWRLLSWGEWPLGGRHLADPRHTGPGGEPD